MNRDLGWQYYRYRNYDPMIARFHQVESLIDKYPWLGYVFDENKVTYGVEIEGLEMHSHVRLLDPYDVGGTGGGGGTYVPDDEDVEKGSIETQPGGIPMTSKDGQGMNNTRAENVAKGDKILNIDGLLAIFRRIIDNIWGPSGEGVAKALDMSAKAVKAAEDISNTVKEEKKEQPKQQEKKKTINKQKESTVSFIWTHRHLDPSESDPNMKVEISRNRDKTIITGYKAYWCGECGEDFDKIIVEGESGKKVLGISRLRNTIVKVHVLEGLSREEFNAKWQTTTEKVKIGGNDD